MMHVGAKRSLLGAVLIAVVVSLLSAQFNRYYRDVAIDVAINIVLAVSLNLINGHTGQFSLGHAGFMAVGGYIAAKMTLVFGAHAAVWSQPLIFLGALATGGIVAALAGLAVGVPSLRLRGDYLAIVTLGFGEIIRVIFQTSETFGAATGLVAIPKWTTLAWGFGIAAVTVYVVGCLVNSTYGRGFLAVHDDEIAAGAMGINPVRYKVTAFVIGAFFAGIAGGLWAHHKTTLSPTGFDFMKSIDIVVMVILGGMGNTVGVIAAAVLLTIFPELLRGLPRDPTQVTSNPFFVIFLITAIGALCGVLLARPTVKRLRASLFVRIAVLLCFGLAFALIAAFVWNTFSTRILVLLGQFAENRMIPYSLVLIALMMLRPQGLFSFGKKKGANA